MADDKVDNGHWGKEKPGAQPLTPFEKVMGPKENLAKYDQKIFGGFKALFVAPAIWWHDHVVQKLRGEEYYWYHRRFRRVPTIDECYFHDSSCRFEANRQHQRDKLVEEQICGVLKDRALDCQIFEGSNLEIQDPNSKCGELYVDFQRAAANFFIKYGELHFQSRAEDVLMKQKHRLIWERRHGPPKTEKGLNLDG